MFTNNGKALCYVSDFLDDGSRDPRYVLQRTNGTVATIYRNTTALTKKLGYNTLTQNLQIIVGSGTATPTAADYCLENEITDAALKVTFNGSRNKQSCNCSYDSAPLLLQANTTFYNSSMTNTITINEVGLITKDGTGASYLLYREVLEEPIPIGPDSSETLSIIIN